MNSLKISALSLLLTLSTPIKVSERLPAPIPLQKQEIFYPYIQEFYNLRNSLKENGFLVDSLFSDSRFKIHEEIEKSYKRSPEKRIFRYIDYKRQLGLNEKKKQISKFIQENSVDLKKAEIKFDIPKEIIASIIGIESDFGKNIGRYNPFNAYVSLYLSNHRKDFAINQLEELLIFCRNTQQDVLDLKSSYAGAIGYAQFIPSSLNEWFIGKDVYLMENNIPSTANYLADHKKQKKSLRKAVFCYNRSNYYVRAVFELAKSCDKN